MTIRINVAVLIHTDQENISCARIKTFDNINTKNISEIL
jgi:hypothetical protein